MGKIQKVYRCFVSSCSNLLMEERKILINTILKKGYLPIAMEFDFGGSNTTLSISIDKEKIENSDCVIIILSYLYGEIINEKIGGEKEAYCPFSATAQKNKNYPHENCDSCYRETCHISFTQFEYLYAIKIGKPVYVIVNDAYDNQGAFVVANDKWKNLGRKDCLSLWGQGREKNKKFIESVNIHHRFSYGQINEFHEICTRVLDTFSKDMQKTKYKNFGLIPCTSSIDVGKNNIFKPIIFFNQNERPAETLFFETIKNAKKFYLMARTGVTFLTRYNPALQKAIDEGCECRFLILNRNADVIKNGRYETSFDQKNADTSFFYLGRLKKYNPDLVHIHTTDYYPTFDIEYFEKRDGKKMLLIQTHFLISHLGPDRPMFMLYDTDYWYQTFKDELDQMWENTPEWRIDDENCY